MLRHYSFLTFILLLLLACGSGAPSGTQTLVTMEPLPVPTESQPTTTSAGINPVDALPTAQVGTVVETAVPVELVGMANTDANVRDQPTAEGSTILGQVTTGETVRLRIRNAERTWYGLETSTGLVGWVSASLLTIDETVAAHVPEGTAVDLGVLAPTVEVVPTEAPAEPPEQPTRGGVVIVNVNKQAETVTLRNDGAEPIDLSGWRLLSVTGSQEHPIFGVLQPGETKEFPGPEGNIWNNSQSDPAELYAPGGVLVDSYP